MHHRSPEVPRHVIGTGSDTAQRMVEGATVFLASLTADQQAQALFPAVSEERLNWHYIPHERKGLSFKDMEGGQRKLASALLSSGLSQRGYTKAMMIMSLEAILKQLEGPTRRFERDPDLYCITLFGKPSFESPWGWRVEGHHLSLNFLVVDGNQIASTPSFLGANPAKVPEGIPLSGLRVLALEEDLARQLLTSFRDDQLAKVIFQTEAPPDIVTQAEKQVRMDAPVGMAASEMTGDQQGILVDLIEEYLHRMPRDIAESRMNQIERDGKSYVHFAWAGSRERGKPHYYRLHGPSLLIEYDNTQNNANHIHTVWRDLRSDWGEDLLRLHYTRSHGADERPFPYPVAHHKSLQLPL